MSAAASPRQLVYGPVPSRRLGRSLGVDLVPFKTCTYDCIYCQLGHTTRKTVRRRRWVDLADVVAQVRARLASEPDVIALAGSGEPTLHAGIGEVIAAVKQITDVPVAVITNGSSLSSSARCARAGGCSIVLPSLDAPDERLFGVVNRPHASLDLAGVVNGLVAFRTSSSQAICGSRSCYWVASRDWHPRWSVSRSWLRASPPNASSSTPPCARQRRHSWLRWPTTCCRSFRRSVCPPRRGHRRHRPRHWRAHGGSPRTSWPCYHAGPARWPTSPPVWGSTTARP